MKRFIFILLSNLFFLSVINAQQVTNLTATAMTQFKLVVR